MDFIHFTDMDGLKRIDLFSDGKANHFAGGLDHGLFEVYYIPITIGDAILNADGIHAQETHIGPDTFYLGNGFTAHGYFGVLGNFITNQDHFDGRVVHVFEYSGNAARNKGGP